MDLAYSLRLAQAETLAADLLGMRFSNSSRHYETHIGARFICAARLHAEGDFVGRDAELLKLLFLFKHLEELRANHREAYKRARRAVRKAPDEASYFGARMEVYTAASLVRSGIAFRCRESPDYELLEQYSGCALKSGSAHFQGSKTNMVNKIGLVVAGKSRKKYAKRNVALFLDITNPVFHNIRHDSRATIDQLRKRVKEEIALGGYGSINLFVYGFGKSASSISSHYIRVDSIEANPILLRFMNSVYPYGQPVVPVEIYSSQG